MFPPWCRQEQEKFNIWVAWLNLESKYGEPTPEEALTKLFQRALTYCDQKRLYLALVDVLDRTGQVRLAFIAACQRAQPQGVCWGPAGKASACSSACVACPSCAGYLYFTMKLPSFRNVFQITSTLRAAWASEVSS